VRATSNERVRTQSDALRKPRPQFTSRAQALRVHHLICHRRRYTPFTVTLYSSVEGEVHLRDGVGAQDLAKGEGKEAVVLGWIDSRSRQSQCKDGYKHRDQNHKQIKHVPSSTSPNVLGSPGCAPWRWVSNANEVSTRPSQSVVSFRDSVNCSSFFAVRVRGRRKTDEGADGKKSSRSGRACMDECECLEEN
jgi:hypothetical protein